MPLKSPRGLFLYQMGAARDLELAGVSLLGMLRMRVRDEALRQLLHDIEQDKTQHIANVNASLQVVGGSPLETPSAAIGGMRERFEEAAQMQPAPEILDLLALGIAVRLAYLSIATYEELVTLATIMKQPECKQYLSANLEKKKENLGRLERRRDEMAAQLLTTV